MSSIIDDKTPILVDTTMKSDELQKIDVIPEARIFERPNSFELRSSELGGFPPQARLATVNTPNSTRKNATIVNEPKNNSKKQSTSESAEADIKVSLMVICCPCPDPENDKCECKELEKCDKCECDKCECDKCECGHVDTTDEPYKSCCVDHFPFFTNLCTCFGHGSKEFSQTHPHINK